MLLTHAELAPIACVNVYTGVPSFTLPGDVVVAIVETGSEIIVAFRGTNPRDPRDWMRDFSVWPESDDLLGATHAGFLAGAREASPRLSFLSKAQKFVTFTGHSLGSSMAQCAAAYHIAKLRPNRARYIGFGTPRVFACFNGKASGLLSQLTETHLYVNAGDPVSHVPFAPFYLHRVPQTTLGEPLFALDPIRNHFGALYVERMAALNS